MSKCKNRIFSSDEKSCNLTTAVMRMGVILAGDVRSFSESRTPDARLHPTGIRVIDRLAAHIFSQNKETWELKKKNFYLNRKVMPADALCRCLYCHFAVHGNRFSEDGSPKGGRGVKRFPNNYVKHSRKLICRRFS